MSGAAALDSADVLGWMEAFDFLLFLITVFLGVMKFFRWLVPPEKERWGRRAPGRDDIDQRAE